jgi:hypothetical protein
MPRPPFVADRNITRVPLRLVANQNALLLSAGIVTAVVGIAGADGAMDIGTMGSLPPGGFPDCAERIRQRRRLESVVTANGSTAIRACTPR